MNYNEFITISKENMNDITYEVYSKEIEPCYNWHPSINSKQDFIKWWKANKDMCRWISNLLTQLEDESREKLNLTRKVNTLEGCVSLLKNEKKVVIEEKEGLEMDIKKIQEELKCTKEVRERLDDENEKLYVALEKKNEQINDLMSEALNDRSNLLDKIAELELKIAFTPEAIAREMRWEFFETYDEKKQEAIKRGIIKA
jgi:chromosome segregation ATPase